MIGLGASPGSVGPYLKGDRAVRLSNHKRRHFAVVSLLPSLDRKRREIAKAGEYIRIVGCFAKIKRSIQQRENGKGDVHAGNVRSAAGSPFPKLS